MPKMVSEDTQVGMREFRKIDERILSRLRIKTFPDITPLLYREIKKNALNHIRVVSQGFYWAG
jgi:hypothetical protein